jgi:glutaminyl-peptide cyclotransferase
MMMTDLSDEIPATKTPAAAPHTAGRPRKPLFTGLVAVPVVAALVVGFLYLQRRPRRPMPSTPASSPAPINGDRAYAYLKQICAIGPRPAGSPANAQQRLLVAEHFRATGAAVREQPFTARDPLSGAQVNMVNLIGSWHPDRAERIVIGVHYDTRPFPDLDPDPAKRKAPFIGANDGASGVALLMEMAHHMGTLPTPWGVDFVLFDGEELVYDRVGEYFLGSKEFAKQYKQGRRAKRIRYRYVHGLVLDMVGDKELNIEQEPQSLRFNRPLVREIWSIAAALNASGFKNRIGPEVLDDHLPLNDAGIPSIDIIDFGYPQWHTSQDLPEFCSGDSLAQVGRVVTAWLSQPKARKR